MLQIVGMRPGASFVSGVPRNIENLHLLISNYATITNAIPVDQKFNIYYTISHHTGASASDALVKGSSTFVRQEVLAFEILRAITTKPYDYRAVVAEALDLPASTVTIINAGSSLQFLVYLTETIAEINYFTTNVGFYLDVCAKIDERLKEKSLSGYTNPTAFSFDSLLPLPGTRIEKEGEQSKECSLVEYSREIVTVDLKRLAGYEAIERENVSSDEVRRTYPSPDFEAISEECEFVKWSIDKPEELSQQNFLDLTNILSHQPSDVEIGPHNLKHDARGLAEWVREQSKDSPSLMRLDLDRLWTRAKDLGVKKCETIQVNSGKCKSCKHYQNIETPLAIRSKEHVGSAQVGFWVRSKKGEYLYPNYADLANLFKEKYKLKSFGEGRFYAYSGGIYKRVGDHYLKTLMESEMNPQHPVREFHRNEFIAKLRAQCGLSEEEERAFFGKTVTDRICFKNGVYDFKQQKLLPHSNEYGFKSQIPHDWVTNPKPRLFLNWLTTITQNNTDLRVLLLDMMGYCMWPKYDNHVFFILSGDGKNGKSTLLRILGAVLGEHNVSHVSLAQLVNNNFAPARLDGKCANLSDEGSGVTLDGTRLNKVKSLSSGEPFPVEEKGKTGYDMLNTAKIIFSVNRAPDFRENSEAIRRRLVTIPFNYKIPFEDDSVGEALEAEAPLIASMLCRHIEDNLNFREEKLKGKPYIIHKNIQEVKSANLEMLSANNPVAEWARETLEDASTEMYQSLPQLYSEFKAWCLESGEEDAARMTRKTFSMNFKSFVVPDSNKYGKKRMYCLSAKTHKPINVVFGIKHKGATYGWSDKEET